jgi:5'-3' exonuclease
MAGPGADAPSSMPACATDSILVGVSMGSVRAMTSVHLLDGTYELFRHFFGAPPHTTAEGHEVGAVRGVLESVLNLFAEGATHLGVATDHVIESFRNGLWAGYKTGEGIDPVLWGQAHPLERALTAMGVVVWPMIEFEADDALAAAAAAAAQDPAVEQVLILTPDKDLGQCVVGTRIVQFDRRARKLIDHDGVVEKFGVPPESIPDYLALVGDTADGYPGLPGFGAKTASALLARYGHLEDIPLHAGQWDVAGLRGVAKLAATFAERRDDAFLFRTVATVRYDAIALPGGIESLRWQGPTAEFAAVCDLLESPRIAERARSLAARRS